MAKIADYFRMSTHYKFFYDYNASLWRVYDGANAWSGPDWQRIFTNRVMSFNGTSNFDWANPVDNWRVDIKPSTKECWIVVFGKDEQNDPVANGGCYFPGNVEADLGTLFPPQWPTNQPDDPRPPTVIMGPWKVVWKGSYTLGTYCLVGGVFQWQVHTFDDCIYLANFGGVVKADLDSEHRGIAPLCDYTLLARKSAGNPMGPVNYLGWRRRNMYGGYVIMAQVNVECNTI